MSFIALGIEADQILVAAARPAGQSFKIETAVSIPLLEQNKEAIDDEAIGELLKTELAKRNLVRCDAIVVVNRSSVEIRELNLPPAPDNELADMVKLIAKNEFATLNDNWLLDFVPLSHDPTAPRKVLATGLSPECHLQLTKICELANIKVKHIVLQPFASFDLLRPKLAADKCRIIVLPHGDQADLVFVNGHEVVTTRTVRVAGDSEPQQRSQMLAAEIKRTLVSSRSSLGERQVQELLIVGDEGRNADLHELLQEQFDFDVRLLAAFEQVSQSSRLSLPASPERFAPLLGALTQQFSGRRHAIDFLHPRKPVVQKDDRSRLYLYGGLAVAAALLTLIFCWWTLRSQANEIAQLNEELVTAINMNKGKGTQPSVEQIVGEVSKIDNWKRFDINWLEEIYQYSERFLTPDDAIVDSFDAGLRREQPTIIVRSRMADTQTESAAIEKLSSRPYDVVPSKWIDSDEDPSYPTAIDFNVFLTEDRSDFIKQIDKQTVEFLKQRNIPTKPANGPSE